MLLPNAGLEDHPDGTGNINALINGNWVNISETINAGAGATLRQDNGTPGNSGTVLTCNRSIFTADMVGALIRFADEAVAEIASVSTTTTAVATTSQNIVAQAFDIYPASPTQYLALLRGLTKRHIFDATDTLKVPTYDHALLRCVMTFPGGTNVTLGNVLYGGGSNAIPGNSNDLNWDNSNKLLAILGSGASSGLRVVTVIRSDLVTVNSATGSQTPDFGNANNFRYNVVGNITINAPSNVKIGATYRVAVQQDGTGGWTVTWNAVFKNATLQPAGTGANAYQIATFLAIATNELVCITA